MAEPELVEDFFGVYLLICLNPRYKGRTYIGYTRDPKRRITQHNRGSAAGGAHRTSNRGPWKMVLIVHGFPNNISALRFEWAWQNPTKTLRLQHLNLKKIPRKETVYKFKLRVLSEMLRVGPWCRLPLIVRWLETEYFEEFPEDKKPPDHMSITFGPVKSRNLKKNTSDPTPSFSECLLCCEYITNSQVKLTCLNTTCKLECHITCLADKFIVPGEYVPIEGLCPICKTKLKWGDLIRKMRGCKMTPTEINTENEEVESADENVDDEENCDKSLTLSNENTDDENENCIPSAINIVSKDNNIIHLNDDSNSEEENSDKNIQILHKKNYEKIINGDASDDISNDSDDDDLMSVLEKANDRRPSWLFEDI